MKGWDRRSLLKVQKVLFPPASLSWARYVCLPFALEVGGEHSKETSVAPAAAQALAEPPSQITIRERTSQPTGAGWGHSRLRDRPT